MLSFPYQRVLTPEGFLWRPLLTAELHRGRVRFRADFLVDSGADLSMIPWSAGHALGLARRQGEDARVLDGLGGTAPYVRRRVRIYWPGGILSLELAWAQVDSVPFVLGFQDFFAQFKVCFDPKRRRFSLAPQRAGGQRRRAV